MKTNSIIKYLALIGIAFSIYLVIGEFISEGYCPKFFEIPACWLVLLAFVMVFFSTIPKKGKALLFYPGAILGIILAINFSAKQLLSIDQCPVMFGLPLCYVSFLTFGLMILLFMIPKKFKN